MSVAPQIVLNLDDYEPDRYARSATLRQAGFEVMEAGNGAEAVSLARQHKPALVILDVHMPGMDGLEACREIKAALPGTPVLHVSSGYSALETRIASLEEAGADAYLPEPVESGVLIATVKALLRMRSATARLEQEIEARRIAEQRLRIALEGAGMVTWTARPESAEFLMAPDVAIHPGDRDRFWAELQEAVMSRGSLSAEFRTTLPDGSTRWLASWGSLVGSQPPEIFGVVQDVTARKLAEEELRGSRERFELAQRAARIGTFDMDLATGKVTWTEELEALYGFPPGGFGGDYTAWMAIIHPDDRDRVVACFASAAESGGDFDLLFRISRQDGALRWMRSLGAVRAATPGRDARVLGINIDITAQVEAEARLRESETRYRSLADAIPHMVWMTSGGGVLGYVNARLTEFTGCTAEQIRGSGWKECLHPEEAASAEQLWRSAFGAGRAVEAEHRLRRASGGAYRWHLVRAMPVFSSSGEVVRWFGTCTDIEEQKQVQESLRRAEERFRRLWDANIVGIVAADLEKVRDANEVFLAMLGYSREELAAGELRWDRLTPAEYRRHDERALEQLMERGSSDPFEKEYLRKDGSRVPILIGGALLDREPMQWLCFVLDLTERQALERKLLEKQKTESIGVLAAGLAHDFNNLLTGILGNATLVMDALGKASPQRGRLAEVLRVSQSAADLTRQMLAYSGKGRFVVRPLDLSVLVAANRDLLRRAISSQIDIEFSLASDLPAIEADARQVQQIVMNLATNAAEAIGDRPGAMRIGTRRLMIDEECAERDFAGYDLAPGLYACLEVRDKGCGMDDAVRSRIFDPLFTTKFQGRGLGLAAVAGIVRGHHGAIAVETAPAAGSIFRVVLPGASVRVATPGHFLRTEDLSGEGGILVVDDEDCVRQAAKEMLEHFGYTVWVARDGREGLEACRRLHGQISAILLGLAMPVMDGVGFLAAARECCAQIPILLTSGYDEREAMGRFGSAGAAGVIQTPYTPVELAAKVKRILERTRAGQD